MCCRRSGLDAHGRTPLGDYKYQEYERHRIPSNRFDRQGNCAYDSGLEQNPAEKARRVRHWRTSRQWHPCGRTGSDT